MVTRSLVSVVDDDESVRESLPDMLRLFGFAAEGFASAEAFLASDLVGRTSCLILDVAMPGMSGPDLQRELTSRRSHIPIVFITAIADNTIRTRVLADGAVECLFKPFSEAALLDALNAARASGVDEVANTIEVLPASQNDDRIRWATYYRIYTDDFLSWYAPGGEPGVLRELRDQRLFPGMQPVGRYPIHIIVKNGRITLLGVVDNAADRQLAEVRAREVTGVFDVANNLTVAGQGHEGAGK